MDLTFTVPVLGCPDVFSGYGNVLRGLALGLQENTSDENTDCFYSTDQAAINFESVYSNLQSLTADNWVEPIKYGAQHIVELSNADSACSLITFVKQFDTRVSSWSGTMDFLFTIVFGIFYSSEIVLGAWNNFVQATDCRSMGKGFGQLLRVILTYEAPEETFFSLVSTKDFSNPNTAPGYN
mmetsp:Transcript_41901/g.30765  ORF Transcript_41901/g.30765 Transcript_41901/m.30765 type:complete len:182 (+) Transcript_41901:91-636(+)